MKYKVGIAVYVEIEGATHEAARNSARSLIEEALRDGAIDTPDNNHDGFYTSECVCCEAVA